jgi:hypothetical protein
MALELDRSNLTQAVTDNLLKELKMNTNGMLSFPTSISRLLLTVWRLQSWQYRLQASILVCRATFSIGVKVDRTGSMDSCSINTLVAGRICSILVERPRELLDHQSDSGYTSRWLHSRCMASHIELLYLQTNGCNLDYPIFVILLQTPRALYSFRLLLDCHVSLGRECSILGLRFVTSPRLARLFWMALAFPD